MSRSWDIRYCDECQRPRVHLKVSAVAGWKCIGNLRGAASPHGPRRSR